MACLVAGSTSAQLKIVGAGPDACLALMALAMLAAELCDVKALLEHYPAQGLDFVAPILLGPLNRVYEIRFPLGEHRPSHLIGDQLGATAQRWHQPVGGSDRRGCGCNS
jgi:hypothetical protein